MNVKVIVFTFLMITISSTIGWLFWEQEVKYALPTPIPSNFVDKQLGEKVDLDPHLQIASGRNTLLHFFSNQCPCSRFNMKEFERLAKKHEERIDFYVVIQSDEDADLDKFREKYELDIPTILDKTGLISDICGIYATPQAVILDQESKLFFKGNYNKARFCTRKETRYVDLALEHLVAKRSLPLDLQFSTVQSYGCSLPSDDEYHLEHEASLLNTFK